jgi:MSHA biogenesis protein MshM
MYLDHFGLRESPFRITPHTEFFFAGANRGATLEALIYAITHDEGIVKVSGEVGSGKTMLCRMLLEKLPKNVDTVYLANPSLSRDEILYAIAEELQAPIPEGRSHLLLRALQERLIDIYAADRQVVVMIDEAHAMPPETLEEIRLLSNLESSRHKLLHIVLFGQPELDERLSETGMRQLKERITHNFALEPLHRNDIKDYLMFRIRAAGYRGPDLFTPGAIHLISRASEGLTRRINILADKALLSAFSENRHQIDSKQIRTAIQDAQFNPMHDGAARPAKWIISASIVLLLAGLAFVAGSHNATSNTRPAPESRPEPEPAAAPLVAAPTPPTPPATAAAPAPATALAPRAAESPTPLRSGEPKAAPAPTPTPTPPPTSLSERLAASAEWLKTAPDSHYFIQLFTTDVNNPQTLELFLARAAQTLDAQQLRVYRSSLSGRDRYGVIYGDYATLEMASSELKKINANPSINGAYIRTVRKLR